MSRLNQSQIDIIVDDVQRSLELDQRYVNEPMRVRAISYLNGDLLGEDIIAYLKRKYLKHIDTD